MMSCLAEVYGNASSIHHFGQMAKQRLEMAHITREAAVYFHSDGVQALGKIPVDVKALGVDLYSMSGHKIYAPKGVGALYVRKGTRMGSIAFGGHHERERRPGTENVPGAVALGHAAENAARHLNAQACELAVLRDRLEAGILARGSGACANGAREPRAPKNTQLSLHVTHGQA